MPYCSQGDLENAIGIEMLRAVADRNTDGIPDTAPINAAITWGQMQINAKLANRYAVPFATAPTVISYMCVDFAKYYLLNGIAQPEGFAEGIREEWTAQKDAHLKTLDTYATGPLYIPGLTPGGSMKAKIAVGVAESDNVEKVFTRSKKGIDGDIIDSGEDNSMNVW